MNDIMAGLLVLELGTKCWVRRSKFWLMACLAGARPRYIARDVVHRKVDSALVALLQ